jgi:4-amino-4-deoxy-L-arabinose transferase-like glycosyltransferase
MVRRPTFVVALATILVVALGLRIGAGVWWQGRLPAGKAFGFGDSEGYWELARTIARGEPYAYGGMRVFRTPGYPAVLAPLFLLSDEPPVLWGRVLSAILTTCAVSGVAWLALTLFNARTALFAAAITALYPEAIAAGAFVLSEAPFTPLMVLNLVLWAKAWEKHCKPHAPREASISRSEMPTMGWSLAAGIAAGLATLMRPSWLLFVPFAGAIGLFAVTDRKRHLLITSMMLAGLCVTLLPWWIRNYRVAGRFVPTSLQVGASLYDGISPLATGASDMQFVSWFVHEQRSADARATSPPTGLFEDRLDARMRSAAINYARANPRRVVQLAARKFLRMWSFVPNANEFQSLRLRLVLAATYTPLLILAGMGIWRFARRGWPYLLLCLPAVYFTLLHVIFVSSIRYRQPALLPLIVLAAAEIGFLMQASGVRSQGSGFRGRT